MYLVTRVIPFYLAAHVAVDAPWEYGPEYTFDVQVNSIAILSTQRSSLRLYVTSKLVCQPMWYYIFSCHFRDSKADSFKTDSLDLGNPGVPMGPVSRQEAYEIYQDQFEIIFNRKELGNLLVNENIQPRELDMIRVIVGQLYLGIIDEDGGKMYKVMENFTQGECETTVFVRRNIEQRRSNENRKYVLKTDYGLDEDQVIYVRKVRNLYMCTHEVPYHFGSADDMIHDSNIISSIISSESHIIMSPGEFLSETSNVLMVTDHVSEKATLYENISLRLESILPAKGEVPEIKDPELTSMFIGR